MDTGRARLPPGVGGAARPMGSSETMQNLASPLSGRREGSILSDEPSPAQGRARSIILVGVMAPTSAPLPASWPFLFARARCKTVPGGLAPVSVPWPFPVAEDGGAARGRESGIRQRQWRRGDHGREPSDGNRSPDRGSHQRLPVPPDRRSRSQPVREPTLRCGRGWLGPVPPRRQGVLVP